jgi:hypothetical protein
MAILKKDKERTQGLEEYAGKAGMTFRAKDDYGTRAYFRDMKLFRFDKSAKCLNVLQYREEMFDSGGTFDYDYTVSTGKTTHTYKQTVYFRIHNELMLPEFRLFPEKWYHHIGKWFGVQDINFVVYPEFSKNYLLQGPQPDFIWKLFQDDTLIRHFNTHVGWSVEAVGKFFIMYKPNVLQPIRELKKFIKTGDALHQLLTERNKILEGSFSNRD